MSFSTFGTDFVFYSPHTWAPLPDSSVLSDAAGALGYGAISGHDWFVGKWSITQQPLSIAYKELFPIVVAAMLWGHTWATKRVEFYSVNISVVSVLGSSTLKDPNMMVLLHYLSLVAAHNFFAFTASYTPGQDNSIGDALSRFDFQRFHCLAPHAAHMATPIPPPSLHFPGWPFSVEGPSIFISASHLKGSWHS